MTMTIKEISEESCEGDSTKYDLGNGRFLIVSSDSTSACVVDVVAKTVDLCLNSDEESRSELLAEAYLMLK